MKCYNPTKFTIAQAYQAPDMDDETNPDEMLGPGGMSMRQIHELVKESVIQDEILSKNRPGKPGCWQKIRQWLNLCSTQRK